MGYHPQVFISYSHTSPEHKKKVLSLSRRMMADGIDVILDQWELYPGHDQYDFMEKIAKDAAIDKILIICDRGYKDKAENSKGGVGVEEQIIRPEIYRHTKQGKYIPVLFEKDEKGEPLLPVFLRSRVYIDLAEKSVFSTHYEDLVREIYGRRKLNKPKIGYPPIYVLQEEITTEEYDDDPFFVFGMEKAARVLVGKNEILDRGLNLMGLSWQENGEDCQILFGYDTPNYFRFIIRDGKQSVNYAMELHERPGFIRFMHEFGEWFKEGTIIWIGLKAFENSEGKDIVFAISDDIGLESCLYVLRRKLDKWVFIADLSGQDRYFLKNNKICVKIGAQGADDWYKLTDRGVFERDIDAYQIIE